MSFHAPDKYRVNGGQLGTDADAGNNGLFFVRSPNAKETAPMRIIASDGAGWDHVSISFSHRCPTWAEMCLVKSLFWDDEDAVMQLHRPQSEWVNNHNFCLHLWRPTGGAAIPLPPSIMVGFKNAGVLA